MLGRHKSFYGKKARILGSNFSGVEKSEFVFGNGKAHFVDEDGFGGLWETFYSGGEFDVMEEMIAGPVGRGFGDRVMERVEELIRRDESWGGESAESFPFTTPSYSEVSGRAGEGLGKGGEMDKDRSRGEETFLTTSETGEIGSRQMVAVPDMDEL